METEMNENPYKKDTPVIPFSNGTEYMIWQDNNCAKCEKYEAESTHVKDAGCELAFYLDLGTVGDDVPLWVCREIGVDNYDPLYGFCHLRDKCSKRKSEEDELIIF